MKMYGGAVYRWSRGQVPRFKFTLIVSHRRKSDKHLLISPVPSLIAKFSARWQAAEARADDFFP